MKRLTNALVTAACLALAGQAHAQDGSTPAVATRSNDPGARLHEGFYLRFGTGLGAYSETIRRSGGDDNSRVSGVSSVSEFALGGTVGDGLIIGGGVWGASVLATDRNIGAEAPPSDVIDGRGDFQLVGPFADYYFDARKGMHIQAAIGLANVRGFGIDPVKFDEDRISVGAGLMLGFGYEWWVSDEWGLGVLGRLALGITGQKDEAGRRWYHFVGTTPSVLFTATYN